VFSEYLEYPVIDRLHPIRGLPNHVISVSNHTHIFSDA
jgi:hypothetical protein